MQGIDSEPPASATLGGSEEHPESGYAVFPGERLATFFFRLQSGLGWPVNDAIPITDHVPPRLHAFIEESIGEHFSMASEVLLASILFHSVEENIGESSSLAAMMRAFDIGFPLTQEEAQRPLSPTWADVCVVEVVVPLKATFLITSFKRGADPTPVPDLSEPPDEIISDALDVALTAVRTFQTAHVAALRRPVKLIARQHLPALLPYGLRDASSWPFDGGTIGFILVNERFERFGDGEELSDKQREAIFRAHRVPLRVRGYTDLYNQASVALRIDGHTRECAVMIGAASELFLNNLIQHLRWESGLTPERSAGTWNEAFIARVRSELPHCVGGNWDPSSDSPFGRWYKRAYGLRNRVAHGGVEPSVGDCEEAIAALDDLVVEVAVRLTTGKQLKQFPRVATMLFGARLAPRLNRLPWLQELQNSPTEVNWMDTSSRWLDAHDRLLRDAVERRRPQAAKANLLSLWDGSSSAPHDWILVDEDTGLAAEVGINADKVVMPKAPIPFGQIDPDSQVGGPYIVAHARAQGDVLRVGPWVEQYHLNWLLGVMVDGSDAQQPWPVAPVDRT